MRITNPNWHPASLAQLTVAQRHNLKLLGLDAITPKGGKATKSLSSLVRHGLATKDGQSYSLTAKGKRFLAGYSQ